LDQNIEQIKTIVAEIGQRYLGKGGNVQFAGVEGGTVRIAPTGFCWR